MMLGILLSFLIFCQDNGNNFLKESLCHIVWDPIKISYFPLYCFLYIFSFSQSSDILQYPISLHFSARIIMENGHWVFRRTKIVKHITRRCPVFIFIHYYRDNETGSIIELSRTRLIFRATPRASMPPWLSYLSIRPNRINVAVY